MSALVLVVVVVVVAVCVCVCVFVCVRVRACVRARACVRVQGQVRGSRFYLRGRGSTKMCNKTSQTATAKAYVPRYDHISSRPFSRQPLSFVWRKKCFQSLIFGFWFSLQPVAAQISDVCNSRVSQGESLCDPLYDCVRNRCLYKCEGHHCSQHGVCYVQHLNGTAAPKCL